MTALCYQYGKIRPVEESRLPLNDLALLRGYGVFEFLRTCGGSLFCWEEHLARLHHSAEALHLKVPLTDEELRVIAQKLIAGSDLAIPALRILLTGGAADADPLLSDPQLIMIAEELTTYPDALYQRGMRLLSVKYQRELPGVKTLNYINDLRLLPLRRRQHADELLYYTENGITECPRSSFFLFAGETLITPAADILPGVTRQLVLELAGQAFPVKEGVIPLSEVHQAQEAFITSTSKGVMPVTEVDGNPLGTGEVGERTRIIRHLFEEYMAQYQCN